jgi:hypothetical protein
MGTMRCQCCLAIKPVRLEHDGQYYCGVWCAQAWGEHRRDVGLLAAARALEADERAAACLETRFEARVESCRTVER